MADRIDTTVQAVQPPNSYAMTHMVLAEPRRAQLSHGHHAVLP